MRRYLSFALALCLSPALLAQNAYPTPRQRPAPPPPVPTGSVRGTVFCGDTHRPARSAFVMLERIPHSGSSESSGREPQMARTGLDGSFNILKVSEGEYAIVALLPGYLSPLDDLTPDTFEGGNADVRIAEAFAKFGTVTVAANQAVTHDVTLTRGASLTGQVLFSDGSPASQINIDVQDITAKPVEQKPGDPNLNFGALMKTLFTHQSNATDDEGRFRISGIKPGTYRIAAISSSTTGFEDGGRGDDGMTMMFGGFIADPAGLHVYSGDTLHKNAAKTYELRPGDDVTGVDITIPLDAFHQVRGTLAAKDGSPINNGQLTLTDTTDDTLIFRATVGVDGTFNFPTVPMDTYKLAATHATIMQVDANVPPQTPLQYAPKHATNAFADGDTTLIVKDSDLLDVSLTLTEIALPKEPADGNLSVPIEPAPPQ
jgi:hypothetical protein